MGTTVQTSTRACSSNSFSDLHCTNDCTYIVRVLFSCTGTRAVLLPVNRLGDIRNDHDPNCTYEGDNNVLLQQTSNYLLAGLQAVAKGDVISSPLESVNFINDFDAILRQKFVLSQSGSISLAGKRRPL